ncbi:XisI protein [Oscillochloris sp. ZM17-4]|uniref:XisI protein n=1 Tax=Oscillochloris sp. ZM17-4 TaxID=2866714 RepID=UPI001C72DD74|nr:XisI protein [Oscillochloris sp. ZM17-4]MBX0328394.1 XisI protein [Oscillochloris sp. ZM17-4]
MDTLTSYRTIIQNTLLAYAAIPYAQGGIACRPAFDTERDSYLLITEGWNGPRRIHGCLAHIEIMNNKVWVQRDDTESGIAYDLVAAGIPRDQIVLGFQEPGVRQYTDYAAA